HGAPIPSAASNTLAVIPIPASVVNHPKSYPLKFSESLKDCVDPAVPGLGECDAIDLATAAAMG
ncbi:hypothetical protein, partial [Xanthomonas oryzae]|uniref:hypothetical protein n=1 Tax=Xanthomonas oryzae TaxID=347 RepID=UPI001C4A5AF2